MVFVICKVLINTNKYLCGREKLIYWNDDLLYFNDEQVGDANEQYHDQDGGSNGKDYDQEADADQVADGIDNTDLNADI